ncbi:MAG: hypothetical protein ACYTF6_07365 [Planctomycetota bacterium]|jgi:hypothetical protein
MSERLSKEERKRLRRQAKEDIRQADVYCCVVSPKATPDVVSSQAIVEDARKVGVNLLHRPLPNELHAFCIPGAPDDYRIVARYGVVVDELLAALQDHEWLVEDRSKVAVGTPLIGFGGKMNLDLAVDFLGMTLRRVLGRLAGGVWIDPGVVMDDWVSWSLDYMDPDMFKITRLGDDPPPDFTTLIKRFPQLRWSGRTASGGKPWWRFWRKR